MLLQDPFLNQNLNPLFINSLRDFWTALDQAKSENPEQVKLTQINLLRFIFRRLFQPLYFKHTPPANGNVFLLTKVHTDGIGDYISLLKCSKILKEAHPNLNIQAAFTHYQGLPAINTQDYLMPPKMIHAFLETPEEPILEPVLKGEQGKVSNPLHVKAANFYNLLKDSKAIIHIALALNTFDNPLLAQKSFYFSETGNFQGIGNYLQRNWYSMGLQPFEEGIFLRRTFPKTTPWIDPKLPTIFDKNKNVHLGYISKIPEQLVLYIYLLCLLNKGKSGDISILIPKLIKKGQMPFNTGWLKDHGISKMVLEKEGGREVILETGLEKGKTLHCYPVLPMASSDFEKVVGLCGEIVGCTGDGSLSDCLIAGKIPFYELRKHKQETWEAFQMLSKFLRLGEIEEYFNILTAFKERPLEDVAEDLHTFVAKPAFKSQWTSLLEFINRYGRFEEAFLSHLNRHFHLSAEPSLKIKEEELIHKYYEGSISSKNAYDALENELKNLS